MGALCSPLGKRMISARDGTILWPRRSMPKARPNKILAEAESTAVLCQFHWKTVERWNNDSRRRPSSGKEREKEMARPSRRFSIYDAMEARGDFESNPANIDSRDSQGRSMYKKAEYPRMLY